MRRRLRWRIIVLVSAAIAFSYLDRQTLPVAIRAIERDIPMTHQEFSLLQTAFLLTYAVLYAVGGRLIDVLGTRRGFLAVMTFWSLACAAHGFAGGFAALAVCRLLLGAGEGGGFPAATRAMAEWFPPRERTLAMGIINTGSAVGMVTAPVLVAAVLAVADWRSVFFVTGTLGVLWAIGWYFVYHPPETHPQISSDERAELRALLPAGAGTLPRPSWRGLLARRETAGLLVAKFLSDGAWYFYLFWMPKYLYDARGFDIKAVAAFAWMPAVAAGAGSLLGGWLSGWLLQRDLSLNAARKLALAASALVMPVMILVPQAAVVWAMVFFCAAYFGHQFWATILMTLPADLYPRASVGAASGLLGCAGGFGGIAFGQLVGWLLDHGQGWALIFSTAGCLHVLSLAVVCAAVVRVQPLSFAAARARPAA